MTCQRSAGTLKVFEGLLLRVKVIVARTPELPDRDTDTCRHQRLRLQPETSNKSPRNDLLAARSRWQNEAHEVVQGLWRLRDCLVRAGQLGLYTFASRDRGSGHGRSQPKIHSQVAIEKLKACA